MLIRRLCESILSDKVIITAADYPLFLFDLDLSWWNDDSNILDGLLRGVLLLLVCLFQKLALIWMLTRLMY